MIKKPSTKTAPKKVKAPQKSLKPRGVKNTVKQTKAWLFRRRLWQQVLLGLVILCVFFLTSLYSVATWYRIKHQNEPLQLGVSFSASYARNMGLDPQQTLEAMLKDLGVKRVRLVSYWSEHEKTEGNYDFSDLDWQFNLLQKYNAKASLAVGLRQPRWPECHFPDWALNKPESEIQKPLAKYIAEVVNRYKVNPALQEYQLENEYFLKVFGSCQNYRSRDRLISEYNLVKKLDPSRNVIISRSNNALGYPVNEPIPDISGVSVYKRVWDKTITHRYFEYPFPGWFYGALAGIMQIVHGKPTIIHELQAEPWPPSGEIIDNTLAEQDKSMDAKRLKSRVNYAESSGIRTIDLWGGEWWYWRMVNAKDPSVWNTAVEIFRTKNQSE